MSDSEAEQRSNGRRQHFDRAVEAIPGFLSLRDKYDELIDWPTNQISAPQIAKALFAQPHAVAITRRQLQLFRSTDSNILRLLSWS
jgi:hypothetical protein